MAAFMLGEESLRHIVYGPEVRTDFRLMEVDDALLDDIEAGTVVIKGHPTDEAVLCTQSATFAMKLVETTNSLMLASVDQARETVQPDSHQGSPDKIPRHCGLLTQLRSDKADKNPPIRICATASSHIELVRTAPRFDRLDNLLRESVCDEGKAKRSHGGEDTGSIEEDASMAVDTHEVGYTFDDLLDKCQASQEELLEALKERNAVELGGRWHLVEPSVLSEVLELLLLTAQERGWPLDSVPAGSAAALLQEESTYDPRIVRHCLAMFAEPSSPGADLHAFDENKVCLHHADLLLRQQAQWLLPAFLAAWKQSVPEGMEPKEEMLVGEVLTQETASGKIVRRFSAGSLPKDPARRFAELFAARPRWRMADLQPFLKGIQAPGKSAEALLLQYCRTNQSNPNRPVEYTAR